MNKNSALAQAESLLLAPFSLTEGDLSRTFGQILTHQVDYADLYFQYSRSEAWSLDEGIVKSGSFNIDQGVACAPFPVRRLRLPIPTTSAHGR
jgi:TldD protein